MSVFRFFQTAFRVFPSVFQQHRAPCEAAAYTFKQQVVAALDLPALDTGVQSQRDGGGGSVAVVLYGQYDFSMPKPKCLAVDSMMRLLA